jgi:hypothetical protein
MMSLSFVFLALYTLSSASIPQPKPTSAIIKLFPSLFESDLKVKEDNLIICAAKPIDTSLIHLNAIELCLCGAFATAFGDFCLHPLDTIKVMQQSGGGLNLFDTARQILQKSGPLGLYQGIVPYITAEGLSGAIKFAVFEVSRSFAQARTPVQYHPAVQFVCAAGAMLACSIVLVPGEVIKTKLQGGVISSMVGGIQQILKSEGVGGL